MSTKRVCKRCNNEVADDKAGYRSDIFVNNIEKINSFYCCYACYFADRSEKMRKRTPKYRDFA